jgi:hypothetical protein
MNQAFQDAEALLLARLSEVTLAELGNDIRQRLQNRDFCHGDDWSRD